MLNIAKYNLHHFKVCNYRLALLTSLRQIYYDLNFKLRQFHFGVNQAPTIGPLQLAMGAITLQLISACSNFVRQAVCGPFLQVSSGVSQVLLK